METLGRTVIPNKMFAHTFHAFGIFCKLSSCLVVRASTANQRRPDTDLHVSFNIIDVISLQGKKDIV